MKYRYLGNSGLAVSTICLGTATFGQDGWGCDENTSIQILDAYAEAGGNFIDTADKYAETVSESIIGKWLQQTNRQDFVLASKCFFPTSDRPNDRGLSRRHIIAACEASLKRLKTDYIDLYQVHESDPQTPIEETLCALDALVKQGKVLYLGLSNFPAWKVMKAKAVADRGGYTPFISGQYLYNLLKRDIEWEVMPACGDSGMGVLCWSPLSGGMLTGKYINSVVAPPAGTRLANRADIAAGRYQQWHEKSCGVISEVMRIANAAKVSPSVVSLAWLLGRQNVAAVIVGATRAEQIKVNFLSAEYSLSARDVDLLTQLTQSSLPSPHDICEKIEQGWYNNM